MDYSINNFTSQSNTIEWGTRRRGKNNLACLDEKRAMALFVTRSIARTHEFIMTPVLQSACAEHSEATGKSPTSTSLMTPKKSKLSPEFGPNTTHNMQGLLEQSRDLSQPTCHEIWDPPGKPWGRCGAAGKWKMPSGFAGCWIGQAGLSPGL